MRFTPLKSEPLLRLLIADLVGEEITRESMTTLRADVTELLARLDDTERSAQALPHRRENLLLINRFMRQLLHLHLDLVDEVDRKLKGRDRVEAHPASDSAS